MPHSDAKAFDSSLKEDKRSDESHSEVRTIVLTLDHHRIIGDPGQMMKEVDNMLARSRAIMSTVPYR